MNEFFNNPNSVVPLVGLMISAVLGPSIVAKIQGKIKISEVQTEGDKNAESMYVQNMSVILSEYKEQVSGFRNELQSVRKEFAEFKDVHNKEVEEFITKINFLELQIENKDEKIEDLEAKMILKNKIILDLGGE